MISSETNDLKSLFYHDKCDKNDYLVAIGCGAIAGLVDIFFASGPNGMLTKWTDRQVDNAVMTFAKRCGWTTTSGDDTNVASAIRYLEKSSKINYDQVYTTNFRPEDQFPMSSRTHHMKSLAHSPDVVGLFFSILNQFTSTSTFLSDGQLICVATDSFELYGRNPIAKLFSGVANWFVHIMSDVAGSSGASHRGSGIVIPFFELFQTCNFGKFQVNECQETLAQIATHVFENGYDFRHGMAMSIPNALCGLSIDLIWALKHYFYDRRPLSECIPTKYHDDLRIMRLLGEGMLCLTDGVDAAIRCGGNVVKFFLHLNLIAWCRLGFLILREISIRLGISFQNFMNLEAFIRINQAMEQYLAELKRIDIERFRKETELYHDLVVKLESVQTEKELNDLLIHEYEVIGLDLPWQGDFDAFMQDESQHLVFKI